MKNATLTLCLSAAMLAGAITHSYAAGDHGSKMRANFEEIDANADGLISAEELSAHRQARFDATDTDGNGALSREEITARAEAKQDDRRARFIDRMFEKRDANADGQITFEEMAGDRQEKMFSRADANGDGLISQAEFEEMAEKRRDKRSDN